MATNAEERKLELERKKQKLAEIREEKKRREDEKRRRLLDHLPDATAVAGNTSDSARRPAQEELDQILQEVGISPQAQLLDRSITPEVPGSVQHRDTALSPARTVFAGSARLQQLTKSETTQVNLLPKDSVLYSKTTQTDVESGGREFHPGSLEFCWEEDDLVASGGDVTAGAEEVFNFDESPTHQLAGLLPHISIVKPTEVPTNGHDKDDGRKLLPELSDEEKAQIIVSREFLTFFERTSRIIERALTEEVDIFVDYSRDPTIVDKIDADVKLLLSRKFIDTKWSEGRCVTGLDYCEQHPELIAASYNANPSAPHEPDGVVLVWNSKFKKTTPEYIFHCQSRVMSVAFAKFHPNLIMGGCYSGQICMWDNRLSKKTPANKSPLSTIAHTHPAYSLKVVGTQNAHNLISVSTDGRVCTWSVDNLNVHQEAIDLTSKQNKQVAATCLSFPLNDVNKFVVGSEEGVVYSACRHGNKPGISDAFEGHYAPVSGVDCHRAVGSIDLSHLFLTSSFDWTVKLWSIKETKALHSFENHNHYVMDVAWSPIHPAVFACVDGQGKLYIWNINDDTESPVTSLQIGESLLLNKVMWMSSGMQVVVGDDNGQIWIYDVHESLSTPRTDEWLRLTRTLADIRQRALEAEELSQTLAAAGGGGGGSTGSSPRIW